MKCKTPLDVYLDIDGVLNCLHNYEELRHAHDALYPNLENTKIEDPKWMLRRLKETRLSPGDFIDKRLLAVLKSWLIEGDRIIFISSWFSPTKQKHGLATAQQWGICKFYDRIFHYTGGGIQRGRYIYEMATEIGNPYVVIDDSVQHCTPELEPNFVWVDSHVGLQLSDLLRVRNLSKQEEHLCYQP